MVSSENGEWIKDSLENEIWHSGNEEWAKGLLGNERRPSENEERSSVLDT